MNTKNIIIIVLAGVIILILQYIMIENLVFGKNQQILEAFEGGYDLGLEDAVTAIFKDTDNCKLSNITLGNKSKVVLDFSCLQAESEKIEP